jgi:hypothetical protein
MAARLAPHLAQKLLKCGADVNAQKKGPVTTDGTLSVTRDGAISSRAGCRCQREELQGQVPTAVCFWEKKEGDEMIVVRIFFQESMIRSCYRSTLVKKYLSDVEDVATSS